MTYRPETITECTLDLDLFPALLGGTPTLAQSGAICRSLE